MRHTLHKKRKISKKIKMKRGRKSRQKYSRYRRLQKGGLRPDTNSGEVLGITHTWQFNNPDLIPPFQDYIFGVDTYKNLWLELLQACKTKQIPVYVITSGNLIGVIRTIQLLGLSDLFEEVISTRANTDTNPNPIINPDRYFGGATKPDVIRSIMKEKGIPYDEKDNTKLPLAAFFDDDPGHFEGLNAYVVKTSSYSGKILPSLEKDFIFKMRNNIFYNTIFKDGHKTRIKQGYQFIYIQQLEWAISGITGVTKKDVVPTYSETYKNAVLKDIEDYNKIQILFLDWDQTVSIWSGPPDFKGADYPRIEPHLLTPP